MSFADYIAAWPMLAQGSEGHRDVTFRKGEMNAEVHGKNAEAVDDAHADPHAEAAHGAEADGAHGAAGGHEEGGMKHLPTLTGVVGHNLEAGGDPQTGAAVIGFENFFYATLWMGLLLAFLVINTRRMKMIPENRQQLFLEFLVQGLRDYVQGNLGAHAKPFVAFIGALFLFIWINNYSGQVPLMKPVTADFRTTIALGLCVFLVVQWRGISQLGFGGWLAHLAGMPDAPWWMAPINFPLHVIGEIVKPISLALRLFGNIFGEEMLVTAFIGLGTTFFIPLHFPFYFLGLLVGFVQAMVFTLLACAYIANMSHHHEEHHEGEQHHDAYTASHVGNVPGIPDGAIAAH